MQDKMSRKMSQDKQKDETEPAETQKWMSRNVRQHAQEDNAKRHKIEDRLNE